MFGETWPEIDSDSDRAAFRQVADHIREAIESNRLREGDKIPSETHLMEHYGVARMTVRNALQVLQGEGLTVAEHGRGVFVRSRPPVRRLASDRFARRHREQGKAAFIAETEEAGAQPSVDSITVDVCRPPGHVAERLNVSAEQKTIFRSRRYLINGQPVETAMSYIPQEIAASTAIAEVDPGPGGIYARLEDLGYCLDHFVEDVTSRMPLRHEIRALKLARGVPIIHLVRTAVTRDGRAVEVCDTVMSSDAYILSYELPAR